MNILSVTYTSLLFYRANITGTGISEREAHVCAILILLPEYLTLNRSLL